MSWFLFGLLRGGTQVTPSPPSGDENNPTAILVSPTQGQTVSGTVTLDCRSVDDVGVTGVQFKVDGANFGSPVTNNTGSFLYQYIRFRMLDEWDGGTIPSVRELGVIGESGEIPKSLWSVHFFSSENPFLPATAAIDDDESTFWQTQAGFPHEIQVNLGQPELIAGFTYLSQLNKNNARNVEFYVSTDGTNWGSPLISTELPNNFNKQFVYVNPHTLSWDTTAETNSNHTVSARATDAAGNFLETSPITVIVSNGGGEPPPTGAGWNEAQNTVLEGSSVVQDYGATSVGPFKRIVDAWGGGVLDTFRNRLIIWGGGHNDSARNEIYAYDIGTSTWARLTTGHAPPGWIGNACTDAVPGVSPPEPVSRHTYGNLAYLTSTDQMWIQGGSRACGSGGFSNDIWLFSFATNTWTRANASGESLHDGGQIICAVYDPVDDRVYYRTPTRFLYYDVQTNAVVSLKNDDFLNTSYASATIDPDTRTYWIFGSTEKGAGTPFTYKIPLAGPDWTKQLVTVSGSQPGTAAQARSPGVDWDPVQKRILLWAAAAVDDTPNTVYTFNPSTASWVSVTPTGGPGNNTESTGTFGRWRYVSSINSFIAYNRTSQNVFFFQQEVASGDFPVKQWVAKEIPNSPSNAYRFGRKHGRLTFNPVDKKIYFHGGDGTTNPVIGTQNGDQEMYRYDVATDTWEKIQNWCRGDGGPQPMGPDEVGFPYDTTRNVFWHVPGFGHPHGSNACGTNNMIRHKMMQFNPTTLTWVDEAAFPNFSRKTIGSLQGDSQIGENRWFDYDATNDCLVTWRQNSIYKYFFGTDTWTKTDIPGGPSQLDNDFHALDTKERWLYHVDNRYTNSLYRWHLDTQAFETYSLPSSIETGKPSDCEPACGKEASIVYDSVNEVLLWPLWYQASDDDPNNPILKLYVWHPQAGFGFSALSWEEIPIVPPATGPAGHDLTVRGRHAVFDPHNNVLLVMTPKAGGPHPIFFFRYGTGA